MIYDMPIEYHQGTYPMFLFYLLCQAFEDFLTKIQLTFAVALLV